MNNALLLTLGHNSSAIYIEQGDIVAGYQNERLSGVKSDSRFPALAIEEIQRHCTIDKDVPIYVSHWDPAGRYSNLKEKYWSQAYISSRFSGDIISLDQQCTHHDAHALSALAYIGDEILNNTHLMVADGFGNYGEVLSLYHYKDGKLNFVHRAFGYLGSMGLLYQYATDYCGFKMNQDEWKLNALANQALEYKKCSTLAKELVDLLLNEQFTTRMDNPDDPIFSIGSLPYTQQRFVTIIARYFKPSQAADIAYALQLALESVMSFYISKYKMENLLLVGGCFMNVQLNGTMSAMVKGKTCIMPLSGDCGAALGLYKRDNPEFVLPKDLSWGLRKTEPITKDTLDLVIQHLSKGKIVNIVHGNMEFGERAYCNTSTLALPYIKNRQYINWLNNRHVSMPMCPVLTRQQYSEYFYNTTNIIKSVEHMIIAMPVKYGFPEGASYYTIDEIQTARPQVIDSKHFMYRVCKALGPLINTSFNNHGLPIVFDDYQIMAAHDFMKMRDTKNLLTTIVGNKYV